MSSTCTAISPDSQAGNRSENGSSDNQYLFPWRESWNILFEGVNDALLLASEQDRIIIDANARASTLWRLPRHALVGLGYAMLFAPGGAQEEQAQRVASAASGEIASFESRIARNDGSTIPVLVNAARMVWEGLPCVLLIFFDVSERKQAEEALQRSEERYRTVADFTYDWETWLSQEGEMLYVSPSCERITGYTPSMFMENPHLLEEIIQEDDLADWKRHMASSNDAEGNAIDFRVRARNGKTVWISQESRNVHSDDGVPLGVRISMRDVTERKKAEEALLEARSELERRVLERTSELKLANEHLQREIQKGDEIRDHLRRSTERLRRLSLYQQESIENERKRIAREIHDELGQNLTALNMGLSRIQRLTGARDAQITRRIETMKAIVNETIESVQRISREIRPGHLDDLGLSAAMEWYVRQFQESTGISVLMTCAVDDALMPELTTTLYRVFQEALTNVARHSQATSVEVVLAMFPHGRIGLTVEDNGVGIDEQQIANPDSLGLLGMRERVRSLGGAMWIGASPERGTRLLVEFPLQTQRELEPCDF